MNHQHLWDCMSEIIWIVTVFSKWPSAPSPHSCVGLLAAAGCRTADDGGGPRRWSYGGPRLELVLREWPAHHDRPRVWPERVFLPVRLRKTRTLLLPQTVIVRFTLPSHRPKPVPKHWCWQLSLLLTFGKYNIIYIPFVQSSFGRKNMY